MEQTFKSELFPEMNVFWSYLQEVLSSLPNNPKPECKGFYFVYYDSQKGILVAEMIGYIPEEKRAEYLYFATKQVTQTVVRHAIRSKDFADNEQGQYPGAICMATKNGVDCAGNYGSDDMVGEAISTLWLIAKKIIEENPDDILSESDYMFVIKEEAIKFQSEFASDNGWIKIMATMLSCQYV